MLESSPIPTPLPRSEAALTRVPSGGKGSPRASGCPAEGLSRLAAFSVPFTFYSGDVAARVNLVPSLENIVPPPLLLQ